MCIIKREIVASIRRCDRRSSGGPRVTMNTSTGALSMAWYGMGVFKVKMPMYVRSRPESVAWGSATPWPTEVF